MKKKVRELKRMSKVELESKLVELKKELMKQNAQVAAGTIPKNPGLIKQTKKEIARVTALIDTLRNSERISGVIKNLKVLDKIKEVGKKE